MGNLVVAHPDFGSIIRLVLDGLPAANSRRAYAAALRRFLAWFAAQRQPLTKAVVQSYRVQLESAGLAPRTINLHLSTVRKLAVELADNGHIAPEVAAAIGRVSGAKQSGERSGNWLTREQAGDLLALPDTGTTRGQRDRALLAVLLGCGLRRVECAALDWGNIQQREGRWAIVDMIGKGGRVRTVPMPAWAKSALDAWRAAYPVDGGRVFRSLSRSGPGDSMTAQSIYDTIGRYCARIGIPNVAPHDLRRTFAKLAHKGKAPLEQIQLSLGHASITTTERYLGVRQDFTDAPCDRLGIDVEG